MKNINNFNPSIFIDTFNKVSNNIGFLRVKLNNTTLLENYINTLKDVLEDYKGFKCSIKYTETTCSLFISDINVCSRELTDLKKLSNEISLKFSLFVDFGTVLNEIEKYNYTQIELAV